MILICLGKLHKQKNKLKKGKERKEERKKEKNITYALGEQTGDGMESDTGPLGW